MIFTAVSKFNQRIRLEVPAYYISGRENGFDYEFDQPFYDYTEQNPEFAEIYNSTMDRMMVNETDEVMDALEKYDFTLFSGL